MIDSHFDDIAFPSIIECIHICLLLAGWSHWWWHISVVTFQMCWHFRTFSCRYLIFIILCKSLRKTLTSLLPGFVDSLQMVSLPKRSRLKSFSSQRFLDCFGLHFGECLCIHCSTGPFLLVRMGREYRVSVTKRLYSHSITRNHWIDLFCQHSFWPLGHPQSTRVRHWRRAREHRGVAHKLGGILAAWGRDGDGGGVIGRWLGAQAGEAGLGGGGETRESQARAASLPSLAWWR